MIQIRCRNMALIAALISPTAVAVATRRVPTDHPTIQACIDAAVSGEDECVVAPGSYHETINFHGKAITVRSSGGSDATTIDATGIGGSAVTCASGEGPDTVLDGFTVTGGTGTSVAGAKFGGGIFNQGSNSTVVNCNLSENTASFGGGMSNEYSNPTVTNCMFTGNTAHDGYGGGMYNSIGSRPTLTNCTFTGNTAGGGSGGGMFNFDSPTLSNCTLSGNIAYHGGGMFNDFSRPQVTNCTFNANLAERGGGMYNYLSSPSVTKCIFSANEAYFSGGMHNLGGAPTLTDCTFTANMASFGGGMYNYDSSPMVANSILWGDSPHEIYNRGSSTPGIRFSDVQGGLPVGSVDGGGNINLDPMFVRTPDAGPDGWWRSMDDDYGDLRLQARSPCIKAGDPDFVPSDGETDLDGHARVLCERVDMGAYEFGIGDFNCDQSVDLADVAFWEVCMTGPTNPVVAAPGSASQSTIENRQSAINCPAFDFDSDGDVDLLDLAGFQATFSS